MSERPGRRRMQPLRWLAGALLWLVAGLLGAVGLLLSATIVLLPLGIPLLMLAWRLFSLSVRLVLPPAVTHPVTEMRKRALERSRDVLGRPRSRRARRSKRWRAQLLDARRRLKLA
jgi:hypothetical protein